jgi:hypothetical protein
MGRWWLLGFYLVFIMLVKQIIHFNRICYELNMHYLSEGLCTRSKIITAYIFGLYTKHNGTPWQVFYIVSISQGMY